MSPSDPVATPKPKWKRLVAIAIVTVVIGGIVVPLLTFPSMIMYVMWGKVYGL